MPVEGHPGAVVAHGGAGVGVAGRFLDVAERDTGVEGSGDERVPQGVGSDPFGDACLAGDAPHDAGRGVPVESPAVGVAEEGTFVSFADSEVDGAGGAGRERDGDHLAALAGDHQGAVAALEPEVLDVGAGRLGHPQPVEGEQGDQRVLACRAEPGGDQERAELVAVQGGGVRLIVQPRPADVRGGRVVEELFLHGVLVEPGDGAQPPGDGGAGPAVGFQLAGVGLDVGAVDGEQGQGAGAAPAGELAQVEGLGVAGQATVAGQAAGEREPLGIGEHRLDRDQSSRGNSGGHHGTSRNSRDPEAGGRRSPATNDARNVRRTRR